MADEGVPTVPTLTLVTGDPFYRLQRAVGLIPRQGLGVGRRAVFYALVAWLPLAVWAVAMHRAFPGTVPEPLLQHFGIHVRCLLAIPLFIVAEAVVDAVFPRQLAYFVTSGLVTDEVRPAFERVLSRTRRLRDSWVVWVLLAGLAAASTLTTGTPTSLHEIDWSAAGGAPAFGFGGDWYRFVSRPLYALLGLAWIWRLLLTGILLSRLARLDLSLVPTHPDRAGGLGFLEWIPIAFSVIAFAVSAVISSRLAHEVLYHGMQLTELRIPAAVLVGALLIILLAPLLPFTRPLGRLRRRAMYEYGDLVGRHGRSVHARWIGGRDHVDAELLAAAELGPVIDTISMYDSVMSMRPTPIGKRAIIAIVLAVGLPLLPVVAMEVPLKEVLLKLLGALV